MNGKFIVYALVVSLTCTILSWSAFLNDRQSERNGSWNSGSGGRAGSWGGHK